MPIARDDWPRLLTLVEQALDMAQSLQPDVLLLDIQMPGKSGIELAAIITKQYRNIKIIMYLLLPHTMLAPTE